jgi:hypothetical protein
MGATSGPFPKSPTKALRQGLNARGLDMFHKGEKDDFSVLPAAGHTGEDHVLLCERTFSVAAREGR